MANFLYGETRLKGGNASLWYPSQLWNPADSGILIRINTWKMHCYETDYAPTILKYDVALTTLIGNGTNTVFGDADSVAEIRQEATTVRPSNPPVSEIMSPINQYGMTSLSLEHEIEIPEGWGLVILHDLQNKDVSWFAQWSEEPA